MYDRFNKDNNNHTYTWQSYIVPGHTSIDGDGTSASPISFQKGNVQMRMFFISPNTMTKKIIPASGKRNDDLLEMTQTGVKEGRFFTILYPSKSSSSAPSVTILNAENPTVAELKSGQNTNIIVINTTGTDQTYESITSDAQTVIFEKKDGLVNKYLVYKGKKVVYAGNVLVQSEKPVSIVASWNGSSVKGAGVSTEDVKVTLSSSDGATKDIQLKTVYSQFEGTGTEGDVRTYNIMDYYYLLIKMNNGSIPGTVSVDFNKDGRTDENDRQLFIRKYKKI